MTRRARIAAACGRVVESSWFDPLMLAIIAVNAVTLGLETYDSIDAAIGRELHLANGVILGLFVIELALRMAAFADRPRDFFRSGWNVFDFVVIAASFVPGVRENATLLRLVRLLRIVRAVRLLPDLRVLTVAVGRSVPGRREPGGDHPAARLRLRDGRLGHLPRPRPGQLRGHRPVDGDDVRAADAREPPRLHRARPGALGLDAAVLRLLRPARLLPDLQPVHRDRHQLDGGGPRDRAAPRGARAARRRHGRRRARARRGARGAPARAARPSTSWSGRFARRAELWFTSSRAVPPDRAHRGPPRRRPRAHRARRARAHRPRRLPRGAGRRGGGRGRRGDGHRLPPLPVQGRPLRRGLPARLAARGRRHARGRARRPGGRHLVALAAAVETFARRALRGRRLAWALLAEPVDPAVEVERLAFRRAYAAGFEHVLREGVAAGELAPQNVELTAAALVGALGEALVGPLSPRWRRTTSTPTRSSPTSSASACAPSPRRPTDAHHADHDPRGPQPGPAHGGPQPLRGPRGAPGGARARGRRLGARSPARRRRLLGRRADALGRRGQRAPAGAAHARPLRPPPRRGRVPPRVARAHARRGRAGAPRAAVAHRPAGRPRRARRDLRVLGPGRGGLRVPDHDDLRRRPRPAHAARGGRRVGPAADRHELRPRAQAGRREGQRAVRDGDDREAGRLGRARQHHPRAGGRRRLVGRSPATSGSAARRCATSSSSSRRPTKASPASRCRACCPTARATRASSCSASRTSSATARTRRARSSSAAPWPRSSASPAAACRRSSRWSTTRAWTASSGRRPGCARRSPTRPGTPPTAAPSASAWPTSR